MLDSLIKHCKFYNMKFIKNHWYNCLHDCIIKKECVFSKGNIIILINGNKSKS